MKAYWGNTAAAPLTCNLGARWRCAVNITLRPHYSRKRTPVPTEWEVGWAPEIFCMFWEGEQYFLKRSGFETWTVQPVALSLYLPSYPWSIVVRLMRCLREDIHQFVAQIANQPRISFELTAVHLANLSVAGYTDILQYWQKLNPEDANDHSNIDDGQWRS